MKLPLLLASAAGLLLTSWVPLPAQTPDDADAELTPPPGSTVITSDELHSDQVSHVSVFTGNVVVIGTNFKMTCQEMTVNFTKDNKVDTIVSTGDVVITQPDRITHCGHALYTHDDDTFVLTDQPTILNGKDQVFGTQITINRTTQKMQVDHGRSTVILAPDSMRSNKTSTPAADNPSDAK
jgi:lipopolysaccharide transport protein LptA